MNPFQEFASAVFQNELQRVVYERRRRDYYVAQKKQTPQPKMQYQGRKRRKRSRAQAFSVAYVKPNPRRSLALVSTQVSQEMKFQDQQIDFLATSTSVGDVLISSVNNIVNGSGASQRVGRKIVVRAIQWKGFVFSPVGLSHSNCRLILALDKQANGAVAQREDFLNTSVGTSDPTTAFHNLMHVNRFRGIFDRTVVLNSMTEDANQQRPVQRQFSFYKKCYIPVEFDGDAGTLETIASNNLFIDAIH